MRFATCLLPIAAACLPLLSTGCATTSTPASLARTERPTLPQLPTDLVAPERLKPLAAAPAGEAVSIDKGVLAELLERLAEATAAVERDNNRKAGTKRLWGCVVEIFATGVTPARCRGG